MHIGPHRSAAPSATAVTRGSLPVLAAAVLAAGALSGCSSDSGGGSATQEQLRHMPVSLASKQVSYVDQEQVRKLAAKDKKRYGAVGQSPSMLLSGYAGPPWGDTLTLDQIDTEIDVSQFGVWRGHFDAKAVTAKLKANGFKTVTKDGKDALTSGELTLLVTEDEVRFSGDTKTFTASDPGKGDSLAGSPDYRAAADCLGDVYRADFNGLHPGERVLLSVLGQQDDGGKNTEVLCVVAKDKATADSVAGKFRATAAKKPELYGGGKVTVGKGDHPVVRMTVPDTADQIPGRIIRSNIDLWLGLPDED